MEDSDEEQAVSKLTKRATKIQIDDRDVNEWEQVQSAFFEHYYPHTVSRFSKEPKSTTSGSGGGSGNNPPPPNLFSDTFCDGTTILCGFAGGTCTTLDVNRLSSEEIVLNAQTSWKHSGLTCLRCSRVSPFTFFSSSTDGTIRLWDIREEARKPSQKFALDETSNKSVKAKDKGTPQKKPILQFDVSSSDQLLCAGTELVQEDSYLLFWDVRSGKPLGAYWESHSDDVTAVRFHPHQNHCLATGSTDGLLNVFNLLETAEEDALQYSFNTNSSVDSVHWSNSESSTSSIMTCVTHTNEVQVWDALTGDRVAEINRKLLAETMMRSNPDAVYISSCYNLDNSAIGLLACSLSGGNTRLIELDNEMKPKPRGLFMDQTAVIQTAEYLKANRWVTFDENGIIKLWHLQSPSTSEKKQKRSKNASSEDKRNKRFKPYNRD